MQQVQIVEATDAGYFVGNGTSGALTGYTLQRGNEYVSCDEVLIMEMDEETLEDTFEDWKQAAEAGEDGYDYWVVEQEA